MAVRRVVTVRAEDGASVPPAMELWEKMLGMEWRFSGVSTGHTDGVKPPLFYHTYQLVEADEVPLTSEQLRTLEQIKALRGEQHPLRVLSSASELTNIQDAKRRATDVWFFLDTSVPLEDRKARLMKLLPLELVRYASKIEIDGVCLKDRYRGNPPAPTPAMSSDTRHHADPAEGCSD